MFAGLGALVAGLLNNGFKDSLSKCLIGAISSFWIALCATYSPKKAATAFWLSMLNQQDIHKLCFAVPDSMIKNLKTTKEGLYALPGWEIQWKK